MQSIKILIKERLPIVPNLILAVGLMFSAYAISNQALNVFNFMVGVFALFLFVSELRFMDELKDVEKDLIANPDRPLPRKAITEAQVLNIILATGVVLALFNVGSFILSKASGVLLLIALIWLFLMYREFFVGLWLSSRPMLYAISYLIVIFPLCLFAVALFNADLVSSSEGYAFGLLILSAFFSFEIGRKLDPNAHEVLKTYLRVYGPKKVTVFICILQALAITAGIYLSMFWWVFVPAALILLTLPKLFKAPHEYKKLEGLISLNLIYTVWAPAIHYFVEKL